MHRFEDLGPDLFPSLLIEAAMAEALASDLRMLCAQQSLSEKAIAEAPIFERYFFSGTRVTSCMGAIASAQSTHGSLTHTREVLVHARSQGWIRTRCGLYRLGTEVIAPLSL